MTQDVDCYFDVDCFLTVRIFAHRVVGLLRAEEALDLEKSRSQEKDDLDFVKLIRDFQKKLSRTAHWNRLLRCDLDGKDLVGWQEKDFVSKHFQLE